MRANQRGFTLFELLIVIVVIALLFNIAVDQLKKYWEAAEKSAMEQTVGVIRSALQLQVTKLIAQNRIRDMKDLAQQNPFNWLTEKPRNYLGELNNPPIDQLARGNWYFDTAQHHIVYIVDQTDHFTPKIAGQRTLHYQVAVVYNDEAKDSAKKTEVNGMTLKELDSYSWF
jgi:general secretion pathway protein G